MKRASYFAIGGHESCAQHGVTSVISLLRYLHLQSQMTPGEAMLLCAETTTFRRAELHAYTELHVRITA